MDDFKQSVMVALLPVTTDWAKIPYPHLTIVYAGQISDHFPSDFNDLGKIASEMAKKHYPIQLRVLMKDEFGEEGNQVDVLRLKATPALMDIRLNFAQWDASGFPFNPHVTIGPTGSFEGIPPMMLAFDRLVVKWGEQDLTFWLNPH